MKKALFVLALILVCGSAEAKYCVSDADGLKVLYGVNQSCEDYAKELGVAVTLVDSLPSRDDRKYWKLDGKKVVVDEVAKQADLDKETQLEADKAAVLGKIGISKEEFEKLTKKKATALSVEPK